MEWLANKDLGWSSKSIFKAYCAIFFFFWILWSSKLKLIFRLLEVTYVCKTVSDMTRLRSTLPVGAGGRGLERLAHAPV